jgi:predicted XRE-type DNA-binding protein
MEGDVVRKGEKLEVVRGSGNVFRDLAHKNADAEQFKAILAAEIIKALDRDGLSVRAAHHCTGIAAADFSRIRNANLGRFTLDRLISILNRLGSRVEVKARVWRAEPLQQGCTGVENEVGTFRRVINRRKCDTRIDPSPGKPLVDSSPHVAKLRIPVKANTHSAGNANGIPGRRRTVLGA